MILFTPSGEVFNKPIQYKPKTCFIMTQLGDPLPKSIKTIRSRLNRFLKTKGYGCIDAQSRITAKDFLEKIWESIYSVPLGVAIISEDLKANTINNIYYEIGLLHALGKEILIIKTPNSEYASDFVRTEYVEYDKKFNDKLNKYFDEIIAISDFYEIQGDQLIKDPELSYIYYKRAYLLNKNGRIRDKIISLQETYSTFLREFTLMDMKYLLKV